MVIMVCCNYHGNHCLQLSWLSWYENIVVILVYRYQGTGYHGLQLSWFAAIMVCNTIKAIIVCNYHGNHVLQLSWLSWFATITVIMVCNYHGYHGLQLSWLSWFATIMVIMVCNYHPWLHLSRLSWFATIMAIMVCNCLFIITRCLHYTQFILIYLTHCGIAYYISYGTR